MNDSVNASCSEILEGIESLKEAVKKDTTLVCSAAPAIHYLACTLTPEANCIKPQHRLSRWSYALAACLLIALSLGVLFLASERPQKDEHARGEASSGIDWAEVLANAEFTDQPAFSSVNSSAAHNTATGRGFTIAIIDGGFNLSHEEFELTRIEDEYDFVEGDTSVGDAGDGMDQDRVDGVDSMFSHGTAVASVISRLAPHVDLCLYRVLDEEGGATANAVRLAIYRGISMNADVILLRLGSTTEDQGITKAIDVAESEGIIVVAAARNHTSTDPWSRLSEFATIQVSSRYSSAAVSAVVALYLEANPQASRADVIDVFHFVDSRSLQQSSDTKLTCPPEPDPQSM